MSDAGVLLIAEIHGRSGLAGELRSVLGQLVEASRGEEQECTGFRLLAGDERGEFVLLGSWSSEAALRGHYATGHYRRYRDQVGPLLARSSDVVVHHIDYSVHALDPNPPDPGLLG
jgi:quinol monooxygenase YgiN